MFAVVRHECREERKRRTERRRRRRRKNDFLQMQICGVRKSFLSLSLFPSFSSTSEKRTTVRFFFFVFIRRPYLFLVVVISCLTTSIRRHRLIQILADVQLGRNDDDGESTRPVYSQSSCGVVNSTCSRLSISREETSTDDARRVNATRFVRFRCWSFVLDEFFDSSTSDRSPSTVECLERRFAERATIDTEDSCASSIPTG